jgi:AraC-like DNA-binding protein
MEGPTALGSWGLAIVAALRSRGVDAEGLLAQVGLSVDALADGNRRHPLDVTTRLWRLAVEATGDPAFGIEVARHSTFQSFHALGYSVVTSASLREGLERIARFFAIVSDAAEVQLHVEPERLRLTVHLRRSAAPADEAVDALVAAAVRLCRTLSGRAFSPLAVEMRRAPPADPAPYARYFRVPVTFGAALDALTFDRASAEAHLATANPAVARAVDAVAADYVARLRDSHLAPRVRDAITKELPQGPPDPALVARRLAMSLRSMQRKLAEEGTSFQLLLDEVRAGLARGYLDEGSYSVSEVTYLLGFAGISSFSRAFKRWTGVSPTDYRDALGTPPVRPK